MKKKKALPSFPYLASIVFLVFLPWWVSLSFNKCVKPWIINWWNTRSSESRLNLIQEKSVLERFIELHELLLLDEMIKESPEKPIQKPCLGIHKETMELVKTQNEYHLHTILDFSTNLICFAILSGYFILGNAELVILNSWVQKSLYNLSDTIKAFSILLVTDLWIGFHSTRGWELIISSVYNDFGLVHNDLILSVLVSIFPVILSTIVKYWIFHYLNRLSPSLLVIYDSMNE
uniref:envelope membrane protein n=1 Tax=Anarthria humilis TaxID=198286 RepID=UPI001F138046|nr:envelope membrane protein [Anarthria humilis]ULQ64086.1 envelope membrane protein [Anarthria humilis]